MRRNPLKGVPTQRALTGARRPRGSQRRCSGRNVLRGGGGHKGYLLPVSRDSPSLGNHLCQGWAIRALRSASQPSVAQGQGLSRGGGRGSVGRPKGPGILHRAGAMDQEAVEHGVLSGGHDRMAATNGTHVGCDSGEQEGREFNVQKEVQHGPLEGAEERVKAPKMPS